MLCSYEIFWGKMPLVVMKFVGAKYGNKNVKIILVEKCPYVVMKYFGGKSCQATYPQGSPLLLKYIDSNHHFSGDMLRFQGSKVR